MPFNRAVKEAEKLARAEFGSRFYQVKKVSKPEWARLGIRRVELHFDPKLPVYKMNEMEAKIRALFPIRKGKTVLKAIPKARYSPGENEQAGVYQALNDGVNISVRYEPNKITLTHFPDANAPRPRSWNEKVADWIAGKGKRGR